MLLFRSLFADKGHGCRSTSFLRLSFGAVSGTLVGPFAAGLMMEKLGPWVPVMVVIAATPLVFGVMLFFPETLPVRKAGSGGATKEPFRKALSEMRASPAPAVARPTLPKLTIFDGRIMTGRQAAYVRRRRGRAPRLGCR